jgi:hypothetical protein
MAKIDEVFANEDQSEIIDELKSKRYTVQPDVKKAEKQLNPLDHDVMDPLKRLDKKVKVDKSQDNNALTVIGTGEEVETRTEKVNRISVALQKLIVKRAVAFLFGNEVKINSEAKTDKEKQVVFALNRIRKDNKSGSLNRRVASGAKH